MFASWPNFSKSQLVVNLADFQKISLSQSLAPKSGTSLPYGCKLCIVCWIWIACAWIVSIGIDLYFQVCCSDYDQTTLSMKTYMQQLFVKLDCHLSVCSDHIVVMIIYLHFAWPVYNAPGLRHIYCQTSADQMSLLLQCIHYIVDHY